MRKLLGYLALFLLIVITTLPYPKASSGTHTYLLTAQDIEKETSIPVHELLPYTTWGDLAPCGAYFKEHEQFKQSLQCSNDEIFSKDPYDEAINPLIPRCFVVTKKSPDVYTNKIEYLFNYITESIFFGAEIVGFYEDHGGAKTIYIVENIDAPQVYRHELQHYFLDLVTGDGNARHDHHIWQVCEKRFYRPSEATRIK